MKARIAKWGNSLAIRLPRHLAEAAHLVEGTPIDLHVEGDRLVVRSAMPHYDLEELLAQITPENLPDETFDDGPRGRELL